MMTFAADNDRQFGPIWCRFLLCAELLERIEDLRKFFVDDRIKLTL
jgi:hypothetical protein